MDCPSRAYVFKVLVGGMIFIPFVKLLRVYPAFYAYMASGFKFLTNMMAAAVFFPLINSMSV